MTKIPWRIRFGRAVGPGAECNYLGPEPVRIQVTVCEEQIDEGKTVFQWTAVCSTEAPPTPQTSSKTFRFNTGTWTKRSSVGASKYRGHSCGTAKGERGLPVKRLEPFSDRNITANRFLFRYRVVREHQVLFPDKRLARPEARLPVAAVQRQRRWARKPMTQSTVAVSRGGGSRQGAASNPQPGSCPLSPCAQPAAQRAGLFKEQAALAAATDYKHRGRATRAAVLL